ncbi:MAG: hypothetical protein H6617_03940 [Bdellovibrionaceae bacterium]|nr:hypothetical protein [Bdellovibrionales bacterium]MCB9253810.1 hypothetical protein [Pseudobdellovibrionaceae bacterium]
MEAKAMGLLRHLYEHAELYTVLFAWLAVPAGVFAFYRFVRLNQDIFEDL